MNQESRKTGKDRNESGSQETMKTSNESGKQERRKGIESASQTRTRISFPVPAFLLSLFIVSFCS
jgi:hypothetical protein